jgi:hypothetical protein
MGVALADVENNGGLVLLVTNLTREGASVFRSDGRGAFDDATLEFGLLQPTFGYTGFGAGWFDYDNDGWLDLFIGNGAVTIDGSDRTSGFPYAQRSELFHNDARRKRFLETSSLGGPTFQTRQVSRGVAFGDVNNDGAIDVVVNDTTVPRVCCSIRPQAGGTGLS